MYLLNRSFHNCVEKKVRWKPTQLKNNSNNNNSSTSNISATAAAAYLGFVETAPKRTNENWSRRWWWRTWGQFFKAKSSDFSQQAAWKPFRDLRLNYNLPKTILGPQLCYSFMNNWQVEQIHQVLRSLRNLTTFLKKKPIPGLLQQLQQQQLLIRNVWKQNNL